jgi:CRISPR-associated protein Csm3
LTHIRKITGQIELVSGLHIGGGDTEMHIGGTDNPVIKNPVTNQPYLPGSSIKGKMRSLLEWRAGLVGVTDGKPLGFKHIPTLDAAQQRVGKILLKLFGGAPEGAPDEVLIREIGPARLAFWDCNLDPAWAADMERRNPPTLIASRSTSATGCRSMPSLNRFSSGWAIAAAMPTYSPPQHRRRRATRVGAARPTRC